jgi:hypothetical protein
MPNGKVIATNLHNSTAYRETLFGKNEKYADRKAINKHCSHLDNFAVINEESCLAMEQL